MNERYILGCKIDDISMEQAIKRLSEFLVSDKVHYIVTPNSEICLRAFSDEKLRYIIKDADLSIPDTIGLKLGARILWQKISNRVPGVDLSMELIKLAEGKYSVLLIGGKGKSGTAALENLKKLHPSLNSEYLNGGQFTDEGISEFPDFIERINSINPDIIFVNLGNPKQEYFIDRYKNQLKCKVILGVGGTIDFLSGFSKRAPSWMRKIGLEWLYRLIKEPWRWKRIINAVILFPLACILWNIRTKFVFRRGVVGMIINEDKEILLCRRKPRREHQEFNEHWQLPSGGIDKRENSEETVMREMREEVGLTNLQIIAKIPKGYRYVWPLSAKLLMPFKGQKQDVFLLKLAGDKNQVRLDQHEFIDYKWVPKHHIMNLAHPVRRTVIKICLEKFNQYL
jgi:N-acetylglucosaminyldiphosphoundecaprenol N-acetyl-beta-D-mannosaminyltransferase